MADIDVERKGPGIWPWIIGLIVLALLIWLLAEWLGDDEAVVEEPVVGVVEPAPVPPGPVVAGPEEVPAEVQQYQTACAPRQPGEMGLDHQYTSDCIQRLVAAIDATLRDPDLAGVNVEAQMQDARQKAQRLAESPQDTMTHANMTRDAFTSIATVLNGVQQQRYPGLAEQTGQLQQTAQSVGTDTPLLQQREAVQRFFAQAGEVLNRMATTPPATT